MLVRLAEPLRPPGPKLGAPAPAPCRALPRSAGACGSCAAAPPASPALCHGIPPQWAYEWAYRDGAAGLALHLSSPSCLERSAAATRHRLTGPGLKSRRLARAPGREGCRRSAVRRWAVPALVIAGTARVAWWPDRTG